MVKFKPIFLFIPLKYLNIFLTVFLVLENILAIVASCQDVIHVFIWGYPRSPWHADNLLDLVTFVNKIEPSPFLFFVVFCNVLADFYLISFGKASTRSVPK